MGLDMYLKGRKYVSGWSWGTDEEKKTYGELVRITGAEDLVVRDAPSAYVELTVAYWRKANAIHNWFVINVQDGEDECKPHYVSRNQLKELSQLCGYLLALRDEGAGDLKAQVEDMLPPTPGFFFGSTDIDEGFWDDLDSTVIQLDRALKAPDDFEFQYQSSW